MVKLPAGSFTLSIHTAESAAASGITVATGAQFVGLQTDDDSKLTIAVQFCCLDAAREYVAAVRPRLVYLVQVLPLIPDYWQETPARAVPDVAPADVTLH